MLAQLPAGLLVTRGDVAQPAPGLSSSYAAVPWLIAKVALAQSPSATAFVALKRAPESRATRRAFAGFGNPVFADAATAAAAGGRRSLLRNLSLAQSVDDTEQALAGTAAKPPGAASIGLAEAYKLLNSLPDTAEELQEISKVLNADGRGDLFLGARATEGNVKRTPLADRRVVAFATHGLRAGEVTGLDQPALVLSNPAVTGEKEEDGFLTMQEVLGLKLDADWVVLSACNTASGGAEGAEAVSGLGRAFFYAGARSLLVSNWAVESASARLLTTELFRAQTETPALSRAEALRSSMVKLMGADASIGDTKLSYSHPLFWGPFTLFGDSGARR